MKLLQIRIEDEDLYYKLIEIKGKMKARTWIDFLKKVSEHAW